MDDDPYMKICLRLAEMQRVRMFCIVSQSRCDRSMESALARCLGYDSSGEESQRKAQFKQAATIRIAVEKNKPFPPLPIDDPRTESLQAFLPLIPLSAQARKVWDGQRETVEDEMRRLVADLPVSAWATANAKGLGPLGLGRIIGEAPLIGIYATHERLWKRMGVAVINGERQQRKTTAEEALLHGFAPRRRAELWSVADTLLRHQWRKSKAVSDDAEDQPDAPGYPIGPYGKVYGDRKVHTLPRITETAELSFKDRQKWTPKRCDMDARRVMSKEFLRDLWRVWHGLEARHPARFSSVRGQEAA